MQLQIRRPPDLASQLPYGWEAVPRDLSFELTNVFNWILSSLNGILYREYGVFSDIPLVCSRLFHCFLSLTVGCPYRWCLQWGGREEVWEIPRAVQQSDLINLQATHQSVPDPCTNQRGEGWCLSPCSTMGQPITLHHLATYQNQPFIITSQSNEPITSLNSTRQQSDLKDPCQSHVVLWMCWCVSELVLLLYYTGILSALFSKQTYFRFFLFKCEYIMLHCVTEEQFISFHTTTLNVWFIDMQPFSWMFCLSYEWSVIFYSQSPGVDLILLTAWGISQRTILLTLLIDLDRQL